MSEPVKIERKKERKRGPGSQRDYKDHGKRQWAENSRMFSDLES